MVNIALLDTTSASLAERPAVYLVIVVAYLLGAVPFGLILARWVKGVDLRTIGSGNIGTTNATRAMGRRWGFIVFALDFLKGCVPVLLVYWFSGLDEHNDREFLQVLVGTASVLGHCYPVYLGFKGGKGVATGCGAIVAIDPRIFVAGGIVWLLVRFTTGYSGLASILMGVTFPIVAAGVGWNEHRSFVVGAMLLMLLIVVRHRGNIQRMLRGTEPNARQKKEAARQQAAVEQAEAPTPRKSQAAMGEHGVEHALVIGDGGWGTALAINLFKNGIPVTLWSAFPEQARDLVTTRENKRFLPGIAIPKEIVITADPERAARGIDFVVSVVPTQYLRGVANLFEDALPGDVPVVSATKGIEIETFKTPSQILDEVFGTRPLCVLTGPSHAEEVALGKPCSVVAASLDQVFARRVQAAFRSNTFRVYTHGDPVGAELAAALKNVIAIAAGISDGLDLGDNAKAALLTRGIVEIARFGRSRGAQSETFFGLAGIGDLVTTCCSRHSRNRAVGEAIGRGQTLAQILAGTKMVAEGVWTAKALFGPEADLGDVSMPICEQVHAVLFDGKDPREAVTDLMNRAPVGEMHGLSEDIE